MTNRLLIAVAAVGLVGAGCSRGYHHGETDPQKVSAWVGEHINDALDDLDATDAQRAKAHEIKERLVKDGFAVREGQKTARKELVAQWDSAAPDAARVKALIDERAEAYRGFAHKAADAMVEFHAVLTPEQRAEVSKKLHRRD